MLEKKKDEETSLRSVSLLGVGNGKKMKKLHNCGQAIAPVVI